MPPTDPALRAWWPTTRSLDLVEADCQEAARAVLAEFDRFAAPDRAALEWRDAADIEAAFSLADRFDNVVTHIVVLPTRSKWTVLWNNSFLCDGYDSLCWCLTDRHGLTTIHWSASDEWTTFQSGASFHFRRAAGDGVAERIVSSAETDGIWDYFECGDPLPEEDLDGYRARRKRDRMNEARTIELLGRLGAHPWSEDFYDLPGKVALICRPIPPKASTKSRAQVLRGGDLP